MYDFMCVLGTRAVTLVNKYWITIVRWQCETLPSYYVCVNYVYVCVYYVCVTMYVCFKDTISLKYEMILQKISRIYASSNKSNNRRTTHSNLAVKIWKIKRTFSVSSVYIFWNCVQIVNYYTKSCVKQVLDVEVRRHEDYWM